MQLVISRGTTVPFTSLAPRSIALDGYVQGPMMDVEGERFSFDHHDGCVRMLTSATCRQVWDALLLGLNPEDYTVLVNDIDGDTALSVFLLQSAQSIQRWMVSDPVMFARVRELVNVVSCMDAHGPAYPGLDPVVCSAFYDGAMAAERNARRDRTYATMDLNRLLDNCLHGIERLVAYGPEVMARALKKEEKVIEYTIVHQGKGWVMVESRDFVFDALYKAGYTAAVAYMKQEDGTYAYTIARKSDLVSGFPVGPQSRHDTILAALRKREDGWGGSSSIGGAPRQPNGARSVLSPEVVINIIEWIVGK